MYKTLQTHIFLHAEINKKLPLRKIDTTFKYTSGFDADFS